MKKCATYAAALFAAFSSFSPALSGQTRTTEALKAKYVSAFDWRIYGLEERLMPKGNSEITLVSYGWDTNEIVVFNFSFVPLQTKESAEKECTNLLSDLLTQASASLDTDATYLDMEYSYITGHLTHRGDEKSSGVEASDLRVMLNKKFRLVYVRRVDTGEYFTCDAPLLGASHGISMK